VRLAKRKHLARTMDSTTSLTWCQTFSLASRVKFQ
jgi:hypothetical protein